MDVMRAPPSELPRFGKFLIDSRRDLIFPYHRRRATRCNLRGSRSDLPTRSRPRRFQRRRPRRPALSAFILKDHSSATNGVAFIRPKIWSTPRLRYSIASGRLLAVM